MMVSVLTWPVTVITEVTGVGVHVDVREEELNVDDVVLGDDGIVVVLGVTGLV